MFTREVALALRLPCAFLQVMAGFENQAAAFHAFLDASYISLHNLLHISIRENGRTPVDRGTYTRG